MEKSDLTSSQYSELLNKIFPIVVEKGPSHTNMDHVAQRLGMSKRTLYEIFGSKDEMLKCVLHHLHQKYSQEIGNIIRTKSNVMEVIAEVIIFHQKMFETFSVEFFRDLDNRYKHLRQDYDVKSKDWMEYMENALHLGMRQGVFRKEINSTLMIRLLRIQMESLKRMEEFFPEGITLVEAYNTIGEAFLRSIATSKGLEILDNNTTFNTHRNK